MRASPEQTVSADNIAEAAERIKPHVDKTALTRSNPLSVRYGADILIKAEHTQRTGSFKVRGSANVIHALDPEVARRGVVTASSGNHGIGVATAAASRGITCQIFLPSNVSPSKLAQIERLGGEPILTNSTDAIEGEIAARQRAEEDGRVYISPYNDPLIVAGQGTIGKEILDDADGTIDAIVVAVGGGGMISGIATWVKEHSPATEIIGASAMNDRAMAASLEAGRIVSPPAAPTFSDGTAGALEDDTMTFPICQVLVDSWIDIAEVEIARAVTSMVDDHHQLIEGAAGVAIAGATRWAESNPAGRVVAVSCGANVSSSALFEMLALARGKDSPNSSSGTPAS